MTRPRSAYIHVPFCAHRCGYCDFTLIAGRDDLIGDYLRALAREMGVESSDPIKGAERVQQGELDPLDPLDTLFLGGGTPTHPSCDELRMLFEIVGRRFRFAPNAEVSVEANPLDLTDEKIALLCEVGVNRVSLGVQSFSPAALKLLERDHTPDVIATVVHRLKGAINNVSLDLIFGVPGESLSDWKATLQRAIDLEPTHVSTYGLTWEQGTSFWTRRERGELSGIDEERERDQYATAIELLTAAGFEHYEISNFARPGFACQHNLVYWAGSEYWAYGPGAARYVNGRRETNVRSVLGWLSKLERGESVIADTEELEPAHRARELLFLGLRRIRGVSRDEFFHQTGFALNEFAADAIRINSSKGWLLEDDVGIRLSPEGRFVADRVVAEFL